MRKMKHYLFITIAVIILLATQPLLADVFVQCPPDTDGIDTDGDGIVDNDNVCRHLSSGDGYVKMADGRDMYIFGFSDITGVPLNQVFKAGTMAAQLPAPTINLREGQKLYLTLTNVGMVMRPDLFDPHTVHFHGYPNAAAIFDGLPEASVSVNMGSSFTYFYNLAEPGTFMYHCHVEAAEHMQMGMLGNLYVEAKQNMLPEGTDLNGFTHHTGYKYAYNDGDGSTMYHVDKAIQMQSFDPDFHDASESVQPLPFALMRDTYPLLNGRGYPDTVFSKPISNKFGMYSQTESSLVRARIGRRILLRISSLSTTDYYTLQLLGLPMQVIGQGAKLLRGPDPDGVGPLVGKNLYYETNSITLGGGESVDVLVDTANATAGEYYLYTTNTDKLSNDAEDFGGMMTKIILIP